ncbi:lysophospholipid acyltransferase family protein [Sphingomonas sp. G-3-2-10]|uniref:lysophospholipid acyltransferase family protein n=1 Tax=Sphingomonas sp. G-3-2-10 TaxID=2728838 RepID=UPI001469AB6E|nr:lysophospholipid acyltransferase family protein [Sphingomonas sp. G-3-2-10]NML08194.1 1-acyl-sn-glycerol-3-phosphate acyltransferase [Sphingomonas sp. G-3-2-10]
MDWLRTIAFSIFFYGLSVPIVLLSPVAALFGSKTMRNWCNGWAALMRWSARTILGIDQRIEGEIPQGPVFFAAKHESLYEAVELTRLLKAPATVMKRELANIPVWGWAARRYGVIVIDRAASATALRGMMKEAKAAIAEGRPVLIFAEGTRVPVGEEPELVSGFAGLYRMIGLPVVPVAVRAGHVWPKSGPKHPGTVVFKFGEPIPPGLPRDEIEARVHKAINELNV